MTTLETAQKLGLLPEEFEKIKEILGRVPNFTELSAYSVMWSEHCSYKNSIVWLKKLPKKSPRILAEAGQENAGLVDIGNGLACAFKIESHNHPSALEPYQGAATGVGGINRDIFTMGARPIAQMNTLRFGDIKNEKTKHLIKGVVKGIGDYGNAFGIPTVAGELYFDECYQVNPLVNAFSAGIVDIHKTASAIAFGVGNPVFIVGSATGKDGIHGAAFASKDITEDSAKDLPSVQVGDPFQEKLLLEATLEIINKNLVIGVQDMGAAGIICSTAEMSAKGEAGMIIDLDKVPLRQNNMQAWEILLSESQERMLVVGIKGKEDSIQNIFEKWDLHAVQIGEVTDSKRLEFYQHKEKVADMPAESLVLGGGAPIYHRTYTEPAYFEEYKKFDINQVIEPKNKIDFEKIARFLLSSPNICSRRWVYEQYDSMVGTANLSINKPSDAGVVLIKNQYGKSTNKAIVISVDCNGRYVYANPKVGAMIAVCESARNVVCAGGEPVAITNNLNFGNPYNPEVYWHFVESIQGIIEACEALKTPVTGGNVSFYNQYQTQNEKGETITKPVFPTPTIGMLGLMEHLESHTGLGFASVGDLIYLIGEPKNDIASSEYLYAYHQIKASPSPDFDLENEVSLQKTISNLIKQRLLISAHDVSDGGLFVTLVESALVNQLGFEVEKNSMFESIRKDAFWFGESQSRVVVSIKPENKTYFESCCRAYFLGNVTKENFVVDKEMWISTQEANDLYQNTLAKLIEN
ncbi:MAG: phosphoribosylformylglycinamidine synthase subunit PurL [Bacteroidetes bacterium]|nr:MAG: phosphoribosylformylglycinamidine synthase subunit PurL [Bacteroidota bacterium]TAG87588.1 MAG: phosphoribosylformylglycinamidine synthase subunit PurL [Bacteroidota bacterium]